MKPVAIAAGIIAGLVGALIWAAIAYFAHIQLGFIAWVIGGMVGFAVAAASKGEADQVSGCAAAVIAIAAILGGKYITAMAIVSNFAPNVSEMRTTDEDAQASFAYEIVKAADQSGRKLVWPEGKTADNAESLADYPKDVAKEAADRWTAMSGPEQSAFKVDRDAKTTAVMSTLRGTMTHDAFMHSFTFLSMVFCVFALITAFKVGSGMGGGD